MHAKRLVSCIPMSFGVDLAECGRRATAWRHGALSELEQRAEELGCAGRVEVEFLLARIKDLTCDLDQVSAAGAGTRTATTSIARAARAPSVRASISRSCRMIRSLALVTSRGGRTENTTKAAPRFVACVTLRPRCQAPCAANWTRADHQCNDAFAGTQRGGRSAVPSPRIRRCADGLHRCGSPLPRLGRLLVEPRICCDGSGCGERRRRVPAPPRDRPPALRDDPCQAVEGASWHGCHGRRPRRSRRLGQEHSMGRDGRQVRLGHWGPNI